MPDVDIDKEIEQSDERARGVLEDVGLVKPKSRQGPPGPGEATRDSILRPNRDEDVVRPNEFRHT